ncbi:UbiA prenyltransferase family-domain-containing protein [Nemania serpens]|nr:UbiA prenyltransferase family-domain-containing protein [Nemania serpens]
MSNHNRQQRNLLSFQKKDDDVPLPGYTAPTSGVLSLLPESLIPYGELARIHRPNGFLLIYFPHLFGTLYASCASSSNGALFSSSHPIALHNLVWTNLVLFAGSIFSRAAICAWNDVVDREYDRQVLRCRLRPIARGALSPTQGLVFTALLSAVGLWCLAALPTVTWFIAMPDIVLMTFYPFAKRFLDFPQVILGLQIAMGVFMGAASIDQTLFDWRFHTIAEAPGEPRVWAIAAFYGANICWTIVYDTVYAQLDVEDDEKAGIRSLAVLFRYRTKSLLWVVSMAQVGLLLLSGYFQGFGWKYFLVTGCGTLVSYIYMLLAVDLNNTSHCLWWFQNGHWFIGSSTAAGLLLQWLGEKIPVI